MIHTVSYSEISSFRQCPHKWMLGYRERWKSPVTSPALQKGTLFHSVLEGHYKTVKKYQKKEDKTGLAEALHAKATPLLYKEDGTQTETQELVEWMYHGYLEFWNDSDWKILAVEHDAVVWLPSGLPTLERGKVVKKANRSNFKLKLKIDLIVLHIPTNRLYIWDHKTGSVLPTDKELAIDDQFGLYTWGMRQLGKEIWGALYNAARTQRNKSEMTLESRFSRTPVTRTDRELDVIAYEAYLTAKRMYAIKEGMAERAPDTDRCKWRCEFLEPCLAGRKGLDERRFLRDIGFKQDFTRH